MARLTLVIETEIVRGKGTNADPLRRITRFWAVDGVERLLAESKDPLLAPTDETHGA
jgi:hypothetical protein